MHQTISAHIAQLGYNFGWIHVHISLAFACQGQYYISSIQYIIILYTCICQSVYVAICSGNIHLRRKCGNTVVMCNVWFIVSAGSTQIFIAVAVMGI